MPVYNGSATDFVNFTRGSLATVTDSDGKIKWAPHNLLTNSENFDASSWRKTNVTVTTTNAAVAPNGTTTADLITLAGGTAVKVIDRDFGIGSPYTSAIYIKINTGIRYVQLLCNNDSTFFANFDLVDGIPGTKGAPVTTSLIENVGNNWWRISMSHSNSVVSGLWLYVVDSSSASYSSTTSVTGSYYLWGAHLYRSDLGGMQSNGSAYPTYNPTTPKNLIGYSEDFSNAQWAKGGLAAFGSGSISNAIVAPNGLQTADKIVASNTASAYRWVSPTYTEVTGPCVISVYAKLAEYSLLHVSERSYGRFYASFDLSNGTVVAGSTGGAGFVSAGTPVAVGDGWYRCSIVTTLSSSAISFVGYPSGATLNAYGAQYAGDGTSGIYLWGAQLSDSASLDPYVANHFAAPTSAAYYGPRLDYDPVTLACKGLLVEEQRTNTLLNTSNLTAGSWSATRASVTSGIADPAGGTSAIRLTATSANGDFSQSISVSNITYTNSVYLRRVSGTGNVQLGNPSNGGVDMALTSSWQRFSCSSLPAGGTTAFFLVRIVTSGDVIEIAFPQQEAGSFATSYIPTGASTVDRNADVANFSTQAFPYSATEGTMVINGAVLSTVAVNRGAFTLASSDGSIRIGNNTTGAGGTAADFYTLPGGTFLFVSGAVTAGTPFKAAAVYKANDFALSVNGAAAVTSSSGTLPTAATDAHIGRIGSSSYFNGHIREISYLPRRVTNAELQQRTL